MYDYGDYCPIAKAAQVLGERWNLLILRELLTGVTRFNEFRRYLPRLSPTLLNARLRSLEEMGLVMRRKRPEQRSHEYHLTPAGQELGPIVMELGKWASRWAYRCMSDRELNTDVLMRDIQLTLQTGLLPRGRTVILFQISDEPTSNKWYLVAEDGMTERCDEDRALEVDVYVTSDRRTLAEVWAGERKLRQALSDGQIKLAGTPSLLRSFPDWFGRSPFAPGVEEALQRQAPTRQHG